MPGVKKPMGSTSSTDKQKKDIDEKDAKPDKK